MRNIKMRGKGRRKIERNNNKGGNIDMEKNVARVWGGHN